MMHIKKKMNSKLDEYIVKYKLKQDDKVKFNVGDLVRIYKYKNTFDKKSGKRFTDSVQS